MSGAFQNSAFQNSAYQTDGGPTPPPGPGSNWGPGIGGSGGGSKKIQREIDALPIFKDLEDKLKRGVGLAQAIKELKQDPETKEEMEAREPAAKRKDPIVISWISDQLRSPDRISRLPIDLANSLKDTKVTEDEALQAWAQDEAEILHSFTNLLKNASL